MSVIPTREEFEELVDSHERQAYLVAKGNRRANTRPSHTALLATYDAQAARIAELEADRDHWRNMVNDLEHSSIYLDSIAFYEGRHAEVTARIAELEAQRDALLEACEEALAEIMESISWDEIEQCCTCSTCSTALMLRAAIAMVKDKEGKE